MKWCPVPTKQKIEDWTPMLCAAAAAAAAIAFIYNQRKSTCDLNAG
jgi:cobalamin biosynthesis protein CbiD